MFISQMMTLNQKSREMKMAKILEDDLSKYKKKPGMTKTYILLLFCVVCWGSNFIFGKILVDVFDPKAIALLRLFFINIFLWTVGAQYVKGIRIKVRYLLMLVGAGFIGVTLNQWTFFASLQYVDPVVAALILALAPMATSVITFVFLQEKRKGIFWLGVMIGFIGVYIVITGGNAFQFVIGKGELLITLTMLTFSVFLILVQQLSKVLKPIVITLYTNLFGFLLILPVVSQDVIKKSFYVEFKYWILLIITAILMHGICTMIWNDSIRVVGATNASILMNLEPFVVMVLGYFILRETVLAVQIIGAVLIIMGVYIGARWGVAEKGIPIK